MPRRRRPLCKDDFCLRHHLFFSWIYPRTETVLFAPTQPGCHCGGGDGDGGINRRTVPFVQITFCFLIVLQLFPWRSSVVPAFFAPISAPRQLCKGNRFPWFRSTPCYHRWRRIDEGDGPRTTVTANSRNSKACQRQSVGKTRKSKSKVLHVAKWTIVGCVHLATYLHTDLAELATCNDRKWSQDDCRNGGVFFLSFVSFDLLAPSNVSSFVPKCCFRFGFVWSKVFPERSNLLQAAISGYRLLALWFAHCNENVYIYVLFEVTPTSEHSVVWSFVSNES